MTVLCFSIDMCGQASQYVLLSSGSTACAYEETSISPAKSGFQIAFSLSRVLGMSNVPTTIKRSNSSTVLVQWIVDSRPAEMPSELSSALDSRRTIFSMNESMEVNAWLDIAQWSDICLIGYLSTKVSFPK